MSKEESDIHDVCKEIRNYIESLSDEEFFEMIEKADGLPKVTIYFPDGDGHLVSSDELIDREIEKHKS